MKLVQMPRREDLKYDAESQRRMIIEDKPMRN